MDDSKAPVNHSLVIEVVAGTGEWGGEDGALHLSEFRRPCVACRYGDSLIVVDYFTATLRMVEGVLGVADPLAESKAHVDMPEYEARAVPLIMTAIEKLPKELARMMAQYARPIGGHTHTIAGKDGVMGNADGPALGGAEFARPICVALDTTDAVAGPQLIIGDAGRVRCLNMRTRMVTTIAGTGALGHADGPASRVWLGPMQSIVVTPSGALLASAFGWGCVRRISAAKWSPSDGAPVERMVTTLIGAPAEHVQFAQPNVNSFQTRLTRPSAMVMHVSPSPFVSSSISPADPDRDVGRLFVGCADGVHVFDLSTGERQHFPIEDVTGLALTEDGARLFAGGERGVYMVDTRTGDCTAIIGGGTVTNDPQTARRFGFAGGFIIDKATRSLVLCDYEGQRIVRLRRVDI